MTRASQDGPARRSAGSSGAAGRTHSGCSQSPGVAPASAGAHAHAPALGPAAASGPHAPGCAAYAGRASKPGAYRGRFGGGGKGPGKANRPGGAGRGSVDLPGVGTVIAGLLLAEVGDIRRFRTKHHFASYCGAAPVPWESGASEHVRVNRGGNRRLNWAIHIIARTRLRSPHPLAYRCNVPGSGGSEGARRQDPSGGHTYPQDLPGPTALRRDDRTVTARTRTRYDILTYKVLSLSKGCPSAITSCPFLARKGARGMGQRVFRHVVQEIG